MSNKIKLESIIHFQSIDDFEDSTGLVYDDLSDTELFKSLVDWHYPGEHMTSEYDAEHLNSNFLGYQYEHDKNYLLSRYEHGLVIGLCYFKNNII